MRLQNGFWGWRWLLSRFTWPLILAVVLAPLTLLPLPIGLRLGAGLILFLFLPGWTFLEIFFPDPTHLLERLVLAIGLSYVFSLLLLLYLIYILGQVNQVSLLLPLLAWVVLGQLWAGRRAVRQPELTLRPEDLAPFLLVLVLALLLRLPTLGYAEFHEDEAEVAALTVRLFAGEDYALFLHRKGPAQTLLPLLIWLQTDRITEFISRLPFALAGGLGAAAVYMLGRRWAGVAVGLAAGTLMALNGLSLAFSRMVQYQALILFLGPLALWAFWQAWQQRRPAWLLPGALFISMCLLAHYDSLLYLPVLAVLALWMWWTASRRGRWAAWLLGCALLAIAILASFYLPYVQDPQFALTRSYLAETRVGNDLLYNNLHILRDVDWAYNSHFSLLVLLGLAAWLPGRRARSLGRAAILGGVLVLLASSHWFDAWWEVGDFDLALVPWLLWLVLGWFWLRADGVAAQTAWLWFLSTLIPYVFLVDEPGTHFYIAYPAWALVAAWGLVLLVRKGQKGQPRLGRWLILPALALWLGLLLTYNFSLFWPDDGTYRRLAAAAEAGSWRGQVFGSLPPAYSYFGAPRHLGWKAIGYLREDGTLAGDYRSANELFAIPAWYSYQTGRSCFDDPAYFFWADPEQSPPEISPAYAARGRVTVAGESRIEIYQHQPMSTTVPLSIAAEDYRSRFDELATPTRFAAWPLLSQPQQINFGNRITFLGFDLSEDTVRPGDTLQLTLRWQAQQALSTRYRTFVHVEKERMWGQHDDDPACRLPTPLWRPGQITEGQFRITLDPATPPGTYPLAIGLYDPDTFERLPMLDAAGNPVGDRLELLTITVR